MGAAQTGETHTQWHSSHTESNCPERLTYLVLVHRWPFDQPFHLVLNVAVGGDWGGAKGVDEAAFKVVGQIMEVDWVRVYSA